MFRAIKSCALLTGLAMIYAAVAAILSVLVPPPLGAVDHLVIGSSATFVVLLIVFGLAMQGRYRT